MQRRSTNVPHTARPEINGSAHVVLRIRRALPWLRTPRTYRVLERALRAGQWYQTDFRRPLRRSRVLPARRHELTTLPNLSLDDTPGPRWSEYGSLAEMLAT